MKSIFSKLNCVVLACAMLAFSGCEENVKNSTIPTKYVAATQKFAGVYSGHFEGLPVSLRVEIATNGLVVATLQSSLLTNCDTKIGALIGISGNKKTQSLKSVRFSLNTDGCGIEGNDLNLSVSKDGSIQMLVVESSETWSHSVCSGSGIDRDCSDEDFTTYKYLTGTLSKFN